VNFLYTLERPHPDLELNNLIVLIPADMILSVEELSSDYLSNCFTAQGRGG